MKEQPFQDLGNELRFTCPFCHSDKHKFYVSKSSGLWICYNCGLTGSLPKLIHQIYNTSYLDAQKMVDENYGDFVDDSIQQDGLYASLLSLDNENSLDNDVRLVNPPLPTNTISLKDHVYDINAMPYFSYLNHRGVTWQQIVDNDISFVDDGICYTKNDNELHVIHSLVFKTYWNNQFVYWNTRSIDPNPFIKTFNASAKQGEYSRNEVVFGLNQLKKHQSLVICEGVFNALTVTSNEYQGVATFGKQVTDDQINLILSQQDKFKDIRLFLDNDAKGIEVELAHKLAHYYDPDKILLVNNPYGDQDANDLGNTKATELVSQAKGLDFLSEIAPLIGDV